MDPVSVALPKIFKESSLQLWCQELQHNSNQVFLSAVSFLDTIISDMDVRKSQLQLLSSACLTIASKLLDPQPFSLRDFVRFTQSRVSLNQLQEMELLVLSTIR